MSLTLIPLTGGHGVALTSARPGPDLRRAGWTELDYAASGADPVPFTTRVVVRRPESAPASGTLVVEWLNVSSGADAAPDWTYLAGELVRQGHAWAGVSAQYAGVEGGSALVAVEGALLHGLKGSDPERYGALRHPGDAFAHDIFTAVAREVARLVDAHQVLAVGESQAAYLLTTYVNEVHSRERFFDGFLVHSRGDVAAPAGEAGRGIDLAAARATGRPTPIRDDLDVPVLVVQTEGDLLGRLNYLAARQPDAPRLRVWEIAGAAHADLFQIGEFESFLGCPDPVNRGQQVYVVRAALRHLATWASGGPAAPGAEPISVRNGAFVRDDVGNVRGGVRTPVVDAPAELLSGEAAPGASLICGLFGRTVALTGQQWAARWPSYDAYVSAYTAATDAGIAAGFLLPEDRPAVLSEMRPAPGR